MNSTPTQIHLDGEALKESNAYPSVCVCLITYNDALLIKDCLESVFSQDYPKDKLGVLIVDGGSSDGTLDLIRQTPAEVICRPDLKANPMLRGELAVSLPKSDIVVTFSADNRFLEKNALLELVAPFKDRDIAGAGSYRYGWRPTDTPLVRYFALIGGGDPIAIALGTADRAAYDSTPWRQRGHAADMGSYYKVSYPPDPRLISSLGANGYAFRKIYLDAVGGMKYALHMEASVRLIQAGHKFAMVKTCHVVHLLANDLGSFVRRKVHWAKVYSQPDVPKFYHVYDPRRDRLKACLIAAYFLTVILPCLRSIKGCLRFPDAAWFLHPIVGIVFVLHYGMMMVRGRWGSGAKKTQT